MSSFSAITRNALLVLALSAPALALSGCTISPVYSNAAATQNNISLSFPEPLSRLEQIVFQDLGARFGSDGPNEVKVTVRQAARVATLSADDVVNETYEMKVTGTLTITRDDEIVLTANRFATATYTQNAQVLSNKAAQTEAAERATHALAEMFRLAILAELSD